MHFSNVNNCVSVAFMGLLFSVIALHFVALPSRYLNIFIILFNCGLHHDHSIILTNEIRMHTKKQTKIIPFEMRTHIKIGNLCGIIIQVEK